MVSSILTPTHGACWRGPFARRPGATTKKGVVHWRVLCLVRIQRRDVHQHCAFLLTLLGPPDLSPPLRLVLLRRRGQTTRSAHRFNSTPKGNCSSISDLLSELFELANLGLLGAWQGDPKEVRSLGETYATLGGGVPIVARSASLLALMPLGRALVEMAELEKIPDADKQEIGAELRGTTA